MEANNSKQAISKYPIHHAPTHAWPYRSS